MSGWRNKDAVVVCFASGDAGRARAMAIEMRTLVPGNTHYLVSIDAAIEVEGVTSIVVTSREPFLEAIRVLGGFRIGLAPVLFPGNWHPLQGSWPPEEWCTPAR